MLNGTRSCASAQQTRAAPYQGGKAGERVPAGIILLGGHHGENAVGVMDSWCPASWYRFYVRDGVPISKKR